MVNAQRFRARKVDFKRALPVFRASDLDDLDDDDNRQTDTIETGVEKDEEAEHHLQAVISAAQAAATGSGPNKQMYIPTPDASRVVDGYDERYPATFTCPTSLIRSSETVEECCAPLYCMDDEDAQWLEQSGSMSALEFETAMEQLETLTRDMVFQTQDDIPTVEYLAQHAADRERPFDRRTCSLVYAHWCRRRSSRAFQPIHPTIQQDDTSRVEIDPYVCFRRREIQRGRKTRRADQRSLEQLRRLRVNLALAAQLVEQSAERETCKLGLAHAAYVAAQQRRDVIRMRRRVGATQNAWDELFVAPVVQGARKRLARGDAQRARNVVRKTKGASSVDPALPMPYALPRSVSVVQYVPQHCVTAMQSRVAEKSHVADVRRTMWVDSTWAPRVPQTASFWADDAASVAFRVRRGRCDRLLIDRRLVRAQTSNVDRQQRFRLGLLRPEDHEHLRACRAPSAPFDSLLRPFSFSDLLVPNDGEPSLLKCDAQPSITTNSDGPVTPKVLREPSVQITPNVQMASLSVLPPRINDITRPNAAKCN
ncbi:Enhancer of polycomb-like protein 1 [Coemansia sp. RSA 353]|nr:Enhancer of polycomb-like protein 1 [Coemansia sp. RSA 532]KAJ2194812.1 Enhancer of polycomb-like protein 1 [Coemansia sp. RSA 522]KAJ2293263.1 Enhancer of polycomb-like protein 1 [Coemansia sp. RSA 355]KAJ2298518.1 Enhancer of polycomb-like protein 1 [Coemansia sp. RSA 353]KAJ2408972.1 Enhancer of polycomb-like protein 1 [Coemansia sp. RSA 2526]